MFLVRLELFSLWVKSRTWASPGWICGNIPWFHMKKCESEHAAWFAKMYTVLVYRKNNLFHWICIHYRALERLPLQIALYGANLVLKAAHLSMSVKLPSLMSPAVLSVIRPICFSRKWPYTLQHWWQCLVSTSCRLEKAKQIGNPSWIWRQRHGNSMTSSCFFVSRVPALCIKLQPGANWMLPGSTSLAAPKKESWSGFD